MRLALDAQPGALWGAVAESALAQLRTPPVLPDAMMLTVGGTLSVGGMGETSYRLGAQVDHALELDVVTGAGEFVTCSHEQSGELFNMVLAGLGQCGLHSPSATWANTSTQIRRHPHVDLRRYGCLSLRSGLTSRQSMMFIC